MMSLHSFRCWSRTLQHHRAWLRGFLAKSHPRSDLSPSAKSFSSEHASHQRHEQLRRKRETPKNNKKSSRKVKRDNNIRQNAIVDPRPYLKFDGATHAIHKELMMGVRELNLKKAIELYDRLPTQKHLSRTELLSLAQCVHQCLRSRRSRTPNSQLNDVNEVLTFARRLVRDIKVGNLIPCFSANVHLLGTFRDAGQFDEGIQFWQWLSVREDFEAYVNCDVYSTAINLFNASGKPLPEIEDLYQSALERFPGNFTAYHLSSYAVVPDRDQVTFVPGLPLSLFQAITEARLQRGATKIAYLGLDTAFRLCPTQVPIHLLRIFIEERPASEAFAVFAMACRAGIVVSVSSFTRLLQKLTIHPKLTSPKACIFSARAMLSALRLRLGACGPVTSFQLHLVGVTLMRMITLPCVESASQVERQELGGMTMSLLKELLEIIARFGVLPDTSLFNQIIRAIGGHGGLPSMMDAVMADMAALGLARNEGTMHAILAMAGQCRDQDLVQKSWAKLQAFRAESQQPLNGIDFLVFVNACSRVQDLAFAEQQFEEHAQAMPLPDRLRVQTALINSTSQRESSPGLEETVESGTLSDIFKAYQKIADDLGVLKKCTRDGPVTHDFSEELLPLTLSPISQDLTLPDESMREIYDVFTTESRPPYIETSEDQSLGEVTTDEGSADEPVEAVQESNDDPDEARTEAEQQNPPGPALSSTNVPYGTLRFENWKSLNTLLKLSGTHDADYADIVEKARTNGHPPPPRYLGLDPNELRDIDSDFVGLSGKRAIVEQQSPADAETIEKVREEISRLRTSSLNDTFSA